MIQHLTNSKVPLKIGRRIVFQYGAWDNDASDQLQVGDIGTITDLSPLPERSQANDFSRLGQWQ